MKRILLTGAGGNASRNVIASLRMAPERFYIVGVDTHPLHLECADVEARYVVPRCDAPGYLEALREIVTRESIDYVHPQPDPEVAYLSAHQAALPVRWALPAPSVVALCQDKAATTSVLTAAGVSVPASFRVPRMDAVPGLFEAVRGEGNRVWVRAVTGAGSRAALPVTSARQASDWIHYWVMNKGLAPRDFMLSEMLPGKEFAFQSLWHEGRLVTSMARERVEYLFGNQMPSGQSSSPSVARTVHREDVNYTAAAAVRAIDPRPHGVYCVDLKENGEGRPCVTEINAGRFFTTSNFFSQAGANMPYYLVKLAFDEAVPDAPPFNAVDADLYWVRGVDRAPRLIESAQWITKSAA